MNITIHQLVFTGEHFAVQKPVVARLLQDPEVMSDLQQIRFVPRLVGQGH